MDLIIIGGGAAGFFTAINCAEQNPRLKITILERGNKVLNKVKVSGGGRCNVTHACFEPRELVKHYPRGEKALLGPFHQFCTGDTVEWFEKKGVPTKIEADGRMFPTSNSSQTIVDCLWNSARDAGVTVQKGVRVEKLVPPGEEQNFWQVISSANTFRAKAVMVAAGSSPRVWDMLADLGHAIVAPVPSLFTFNIKDPRIKGLAGLSVPRAGIKIMGQKLQDEGPLLITHWGLSGPCILKTSAWGARLLQGLNYEFSIAINWLYPYSPEEIKEELMRYRQEFPKKQIQANAKFDLPMRLWKSLSTAAIPTEKRWADLSKKDCNRLAAQLTSATFDVKGKSTFKEEFVTAGGVKLKEVNFKKFESKIHKNLYFAGEILNIDAITGGFNFQAAWTGSWIAAKAIAEDMG